MAIENIQNNIKKIKEQSAKVTKKVKETTFVSIITAFGLVVGLAWNEAIQSLINNLFSLNKNSILAKFIYAILMTSLLVMMTMYLNRLLSKQEDK